MYGPQLRRSIPTRVAHTLLGVRLHVVSEGRDEQDRLHVSLVAQFHERGDDGPAAREKALARARVCLAALNDPVVSGEALP